MFDRARAAKWWTEHGRRVAASFGLHGLLVLAVLAAQVAAPPPPVQIEGVPVQFLTQEDFAAATGTRPPEQTARLEPPPTAPPTDTSPPETAPADGAPPLTHATRLLAARALAAPRNRAAREGLPKLAPAERMVQLCNLEALEQIAAARHDIAPEWVTAYAEKDLTIADHAIVADGAAFRVGDDWYRLRYRCQLSADNKTIRAFDFLAGDRLSAVRIETLGLAVGR